MSEVNVEKFLQTPNPGENVVEFLIRMDYIPSVNAIYQPIKKGKFLGMMKTQIAREFEHVVYTQLKQIDFTSAAPWLHPHLNYDLTLNFLLKTGFYKRDCSNMIKLTEDCIFRHLKLNDSRVVKGVQYKSFIPSSKVELILVKLSESKYDVNYFNK
jgi:Holliday junction resolvase RusA-like endonuclease